MSAEDIVIDLFLLSALVSAVTNAYVEIRRIRRGRPDDGSRS